MNILICGSDGQLGQEFREHCSFTNYNFIFQDINSVDITKIKNLENSIKKHNPDLIINCAAYTNVNKAEIDQISCYNVNVIGVSNLISICEEYKIKLIHFSTDYVYEGKSKKINKENENVNPLNYYGWSKREGEKIIENSNSESIVIRTSWLYSKFGKNFVKTIIEKAKKSNELKVVNDEFGSPTYSRDLVKAVFHIIDSKIKLDNESKVYNFSNMGSTTWYDLALSIILILKLDCKVIPISSTDLDIKVNRPKFSVMNKNLIIKTFGIDIPNWKNSLKDFLIDTCKM